MYDLCCTDWLTNSQTGAMMNVIRPNITNLLLHAYTASWLLSLFCHMTFYVAITVSWGSVYTHGPSWHESILPNIVVVVCELLAAAIHAVSHWCQIWHTHCKPILSIQPRSRHYYIMIPRLTLQSDVTEGRQTSVSCDTNDSSRSVPHCHSVGYVWSLLYRLTD